MKSVLLVIDMQKAMDHPKYGRRNNLYAECNIAALLACWRAHAWPVVFVQDCSPDPTSPFHPGQPLHEFKRKTKPLKNETVIPKQAGDAFEGTALSKALKDLSETRLTMVGCHAQHCIRETAETALSKGYEVMLVEDAIVATDMISDGTKLSVYEVHKNTLKHLILLGSETQSTEKVIGQKS